MTHENVYPERLLNMMWCNIYKKNKKIVHDIINISHPEHSTLTTLRTKFKIYLTQMFHLNS